MKKSLFSVFFQLILALSLALSGSFAIESKAGVYYTYPYTVSSDPHTIKLKWDKESGVSSYRIYRKMKGEKKYSRIAVISGDKTSYTDSKLKKETYFYYKIKGFKNSKKDYR